MYWNIVGHNSFFFFFTVFFPRVTQCRPDGTEWWERRLCWRQSGHCALHGHFCDVKKKMSYTDPEKEGEHSCRDSWYSKDPTLCITFLAVTYIVHHHSRRPRSSCPLPTDIKGAQCPVDREDGLQWSTFLLLTAESYAHAPCFTSNARPIWAHICPCDSVMWSETVLSMPVSL